MIYLDNAATTPVCMEVYDAMLPWISPGKDCYGNPGSLHGLGRKAKEAVENARWQVAALIGAEPEQIIFTSGGSEGNSLVFLGLADYLKEQRRTHLLVSAIEHESVLKAARSLCIKQGFHLDLAAPCASGQVMETDVRRFFRSDTGLVSVMVSNNETGVRNTELLEIAILAHKHGALFHTDAVQAAGYDELDVKAIGCDFMTLSAHKLHAPKGVGALFARDKSVLTPLICGGQDQEFGLRGGTENVAGIVGFGKACEIAMRDYNENRLKIEKAAMAFLTALFKALPDVAVFRNGIPDITHNKTVSLRFPGIDAESFVLMLDTCGVCASAGSACNSREQEPSHVLTAMGLSAQEAKSSVRFSFSKWTTETEAQEAARIVADCARTLLRLS